MSLQIIFFSRYKIIKMSFLVFLYCFSSEGNAMLPFGSTTKCAKEIELILNVYNSNDEWIQVLELKPLHHRYRSPTKVLGEWVEIILGDNPVVYHVTPKEIEEHNWNPTSDCTINKNTVVKRKYKKSVDSLFTDNDLKNILSAGENALIYVYSTRMTYSLTHLNDFATVAKKLKFKFIPLLDPSAAIEPLRKNANFDFEIQRVRSVEIEMRQMLTHFPSSLVIRKGKILNPFIFGVLSQEELTRQIEARTNEMPDAEVSQ